MGINRHEKFQETLVAMVKGAGQDIIDRAEELVGDGVMVTDFNIYIRFDLNNGRFESSPLIEVTKSYIAKNSLEALIDAYSKKEKENA